MKTRWMAACALLALVGCDEKTDKPSGDKPAAPTTAASGPTKPAAAPSAKPEADGDKKEAEGDAAKKGIVDGLPAQVSDTLKLPEAATALKGEMGNELFSLMVPKGMAWAKKAGPNVMGGPKAWALLEGGGLSMSLLSHNPSGDEGPGCPKMEDMKKKVEGAKIVLDKSFETETEESTSYGDQVQLVLFDKDGKFGFYGVKVFDHGDDATTWCAAAGKPDEAKELKALVDEAQAKQMAAIFMSMKFSF